MKYFEFAAPIFDSNDPCYRVPCVVSKQQTASNLLSSEEVVAIGLALYELTNDTKASTNSAWSETGLRSAVRRDPRS